MIIIIIISLHNATIIHLILESCAMHILYKIGPSLVAILGFLKSNQTTYILLFWVSARWIHQIKTLEIFGNYYSMIVLQAESPSLH